MTWGTCCNMGVATVAPLNAAGCGSLPFVDEERTG